MWVQVLVEVGAEVVCPAVEVGVEVDFLVAQELE